ncbi:hypothetical protein GGU10DRAFT_336913 [Lentinula aff. detonsa]|uniref:Rhamnogalacturonan lyase domain-containing protein n=1 Tax=Lentinula aff. detonsa TaxID=2804958 RepID=A0AA38KNH0_9AGAR|nr:hypothetical protein GGU10DRAFT_336913 [Lentinula aff. detonsa]
MHGIFNQSFFDCDEPGLCTIAPKTMGLSPFLALRKDGTDLQYFWGIYIIVIAGEVTSVSAKWDAESAVLKLWHIGIPDKTAGEFRNGYGRDLTHPSRQTQEYRIYWGAWDYPSQFPNGVNFTIGSSNESVDWNYIHWSRFGPTFIPNETVTDINEWQIHFELDEAPSENSIAMGRDNGWNHQVLLVDDYFSTETGFYEMGTDDWLGWFQQEFGLFWDGLSGLGVLSNVMVGEICLCVRPTQTKVGGGPVEIRVQCRVELDNARP